MTPSEPTQRALDALEAEDRAQSPEPDDWVGWTPAYRTHIGRLLDSIFRKQLTINET